MWKPLGFRWVWVNTYRYIFSGMNIHFNPAMTWGSLGTRVLTHPQMLVKIYMIHHPQNHHLHGCQKPSMGALSLLPSNIGYVFPQFLLVFVVWKFERTKTYWFLSNNILTPVYAHMIFDVRQLNIYCRWCVLVSFDLSSLQRRNGDQILVVPSSRCNLKHSLSR